MGSGMGMFMGLPLDLEYSCASEGLSTIHYQPRFAKYGAFLLPWSLFVNSVVAQP
tara:strand:+ start:315 stop:479 length:165 start_codon:yes stop_codon:yes gene_type:complete